MHYFWFFCSCKSRWLQVCLQFSRVCGYMHTYRCHAYGDFHGEVRGWQLKAPLVAFEIMPWDAVSHLIPELSILVWVASQLTLSLWLPRAKITNKLPPPSGILVDVGHLNFCLHAAYIASILYSDASSNPKSTVFNITAENKYFTYWKSRKQNRILFQPWGISFLIKKPNPSSIMMAVDPVAKLLHDYFYVNYSCSLIISIDLNLTCEGNKRGPGGIALHLHGLLHKYENLCCI